MTAELTREIAEQIVSEQLLLNWRLYAVVLLLGAVGSAAGAWLSSYMKKRGETFASKADMQEVLRQVAATTRATEEVRAAVTYSDWALREWQTIRRIKLEELLEVVYSLDRWIDELRSKWIFQESDSSPVDPLDKVSYLGSLYFPELRSEVATVVSTHRTAYLAIMATAETANKSRQNPEQYQVALTDHVKTWKEVYSAVRHSVTTLEARCGTLMREIAGA